MRSSELILPSTPSMATEELQSRLLQPVQTSPLRVFFLPFFATSHILPMADLARKLAARGVDCTLVLSPANAPLVRRAADRSARAGHPIKVLACPFPAAEVGLPEGVENLSTVAPSDLGKIYAAVALSEPARRRILLENRPDAIVADWWTIGLDRSLGIPWVTFRTMGAFPVYALGSLAEHRPHEALAEGDDRPFAVPGLPDRVELVRSELPEFLRVANDPFNGVLERLRQVELEGRGSVVNTFYELEPAYADLCRKEDPAVGHEWWLVGPVTLGCNYNDDEVAEETVEGETSTPAAINAKNCMAWLDARPSGSVVFVCFGSWFHFGGDQLQELAAGLESSGSAFLWAMMERFYQWLPEDFEAKVAGRGLVVRGWVPQPAILKHPAVAAFATHCGWNSLMEAITAGVPMVTWPLHFEQFLNQMLVVQVLRAGMRLGSRSSPPSESGGRASPTKAGVAEVVRRFARGEEQEDEEVKEIRRRVRRLRDMARAAVAQGGSSRGDLDRLIRRLESFRRMD